MKLYNLGHIPKYIASLAKDTKPEIVVAAMPSSSVFAQLLSCNPSNESVQKKS